MAGCGANFAKILLIIFNIIFWLSGAALLGIGIWLLVEPSMIKYLGIFGGIESSGALLKYAAYVLIGVGAFVLIVGFFGCCGAIKENRCMLGTYIFLLVIIMGAEIAAGVLAIIYKEKIQEGLQDELTDTFKKRYNKTDSEQSIAFTSGLNYAQTKLKCCGITEPKNYADIGQNYPVSCCALKDDAKDDDVDNLKESDAVSYADCVSALTAGTESDKAYIKGCSDELQAWISDHSTILIGVGIGIACLELFGFIFAVCLCRSIGEDE